MCCNRQQVCSELGFTLLEVLVTIVVVGIAAAAILGVFTSTVSRSADPLIQQQAIAVAEAYLEEIQLKQFCHDSPPPMNAPPPQILPTCPSETGSAEGAETRAVFNDVQDYNDPSVDGVPADQNGVAIAGLANYQVTVTVAAAELGSINQSSGNALRIDVTVNHPAIDPITLSGFRTNY